MNSRTEQQVAVAIDKDKGSQYALKWAIDHILTRGQSVTFLHVKQRGSANQPDSQLAKELFLPYRAFCTRKDIKSNEIIIEDPDISKALCEFVRQNFVGVLVLGAPSKNSFVRFKSDIPSVVTKAAPEFCTVYVISKSKVSSVRSATMPVPNPPPRPSSAQNIFAPTQPDNFNPAQQNFLSKSAPERNHFAPRQSFDDEIRSPFERNRMATQSYDDFPMSSDISFIGGRPSMDRLLGMPFDSQESINLPRLSYSSDTDQRNSFGSPLPSGFKLSDLSSNQALSGNSDPNMPWSGSQNMEDVEAEMRRLRQELKQTMDMYSSACKEALSAKQKAKELHRWKMEEEQRLEEARFAEEAALALAEKERAKTRVALEAAEAAQRIAEHEGRKRMEAETKARKESEEKRKVLDALAQNDVRYRKYTIEEIESATGKFSDSQKVGEGGYGPVYKCYLDHTPVAVKVLRPDAAQGRSQFQQEVEVLSCIRHPNMVLLLGACPDYGCLVYEYMANGSLEDRLLRRDQSPPLSWQMRFRIAAEIATGLLFLHQAKPEPLVHRDLKPANILLDRNFVSKISDVGLARLVPPSVADSVTQYHMTSTAGTFCYIDPEYQQTGMLGTKSDIYSLGIMLLQMITAKPPMGLTHHVERSIERGTFAEMLDPAITDWPVEEALCFAKMSLKCAELRRRDRPDLKTVILPEVNRLRTLAEEDEDISGGRNRMTTRMMMSGCGNNGGPMSQSGYESRNSQIRSNASSYASAGD